MRKSKTDGRCIEEQTISPSFTRPRLLAIMRRRWVVYNVQIVLKFE